MKSLFFAGSFLATLALAFLLTDLSAGEKKDKAQDKKKAEDIVINSELFNQDLKDKIMANCFCKTYTLKMEKDKSYLIELHSKNFMAYLRLESATGQQIGVDFDRFGNNQGAALVHRPMKTEDFQIVATSMNANAVGKFTLIVKELTGDEGKPIDLKFEKGKSVHQSTLARTDPKYSGKIHKLYHVNLEKGATYQIDHSSRAFDAYLYLIDPNGTVIAQNDDNGQSLDSRIIQKIDKSGQYRIVATSLGGQGTGLYTLTVRQTDGPMPKEEKKDK